MTRATIAIEQQLTPYSQALSHAGYRVVPLTDLTLKDAQAVVVQGSDDKFLGIEDPLTKAPVISATGLTIDQVVAEVMRRTAIEP